MKELGDFLRGSANMAETQETHHLSIPPTERISGHELESWQREVQGMYYAIQLVQEKACDPTKPGFTGQDVCAINKKVMNDPLNPHLYGVLRRALVKMGAIVRGEFREATFIPVHPKDLPQLFEDFSGELKQKTTKINESTPITEVIDTATLAHCELIRLHPFIDGNGRTARLLVDFIFKRAGLPYITDWGAANDEYKDVVDRSFRQNKPNLFKIFLAEKLIKRIDELTSAGFRFRKEIGIIREGAVQYREQLLKTNAS